MREDLLRRRGAPVRGVVGIHCRHGAALLVLVLVLVGLVGARDAGLGERLVLLWYAWLVGLHVLHWCGEILECLIAW